MYVLIMAAVPFLLLSILALSILLVLRRRQAKKLRDNEHLVDSKINQNGKSSGKNNYISIFKHLQCFHGGISYGQSIKNLIFFLKLPHI